MYEKPDYPSKVSEMDKIYFTTSIYSKFKNNILDIKIKKKELVNQSDISEFVNNSNLDKKIKTLATKTVLKGKKDKIVKLEHTL